MATPIGNLGTYLLDSYGKTSANREDLLDYITNIDPYETPLTSTLGRASTKSTYHEWLTDALRARNTRGIIEGRDWSAPTNIAPARVTNQCEIFGQDLGVTGSQMAVDSAGFADYYLYELEKATKSVMVDIESALMAITTATTGASATGRVMKNLESFITTNTLTRATLAVPGAATIAGQFALSDVDAMLNTIWSAGGNTDLLVMNGAYKRQFSRLAIINPTNGSFQRNIAAIEKKVVVAVDVYDSDFGLIPIQLNRWSPQSANTSTSTSATNTDLTGRIWFLERAKVRLAWLRPLRHEMMGKRGDSLAGQVTAELTLEVGNEKALGLFSGVNNKSNAAGIY